MWCRGWKRLAGISAVLCSSLVYFLLYDLFCSNLSKTCTQVSEDLEHSCTPKRRTANVVAAAHTHGTRQKDSRRRGRAYQVVRGWKRLPRISVVLCWSPVRFLLCDRFYHLFELIVGIQGQPYLPLCCIEVLEQRCAKAQGGSTTGGQFDGGWWGGV